MKLDRKGETDSIYFPRRLASLLRQISEINIETPTRRSANNLALFSSNINVASATAPSFSKQAFAPLAPRENLIFLQCQERMHGAQKHGTSVATCAGCCLMKIHFESFGIYRRSSPCSRSCSQYARTRDRRVRPSTFST